MTERIKKWQIRKDQLQRLVDNLPATSGEPAVSPAVGEAKPFRRQPDGSGRKRKLRSPPIDIEGQPPPVAIERKSKREAGEAPARSRKKPLPCYAYVAEDHDSASPPMAKIHVAFAHECVKRLQAQPNLTMQPLISAWNTAIPSDIIDSLHSYPVRWRGQGASGRASNFFNNGYFRIAELLDTAQGTLQLPVEFDGGLSGVCRRGSLSSSCDSSSCDSEGESGDSSRVQPRP